MKTFHRENLIFALKTAIEQRERAEKGAGYILDSGLLGGWKELLDHIEKGGNIEFKTE